MSQSQEALNKKMQVLGRIKALSAADACWMFGEFLNYGGRVAEDFGGGAIEKNNQGILKWQPTGTGGQFEATTFKWKNPSVLEVFENTVSLEVVEKALASDTRVLTQLFSQSTPEGGVLNGDTGELTKEENMPSVSVKGKGPSVKANVDRWMTLWVPIPTGGGADVIELILQRSWEDKKPEGQKAAKSKFQLGVLAKGWAGDSVSGKIDTAHINRALKSADHPIGYLFKHIDEWATRSECKTWGGIAHCVLGLCSTLGHEELLSLMEARVVSRAMGEGKIQRASESEVSAEGQGSPGLVRRRGVL